VGIFSVDPCGPRFIAKSRLSEKTMSSRVEPVRIAVLDDYQNVALSITDWSGLDKRATITVFNDHLTDLDGVVARLQGFDIVCVMRERTPMTRATIAPAKAPSDRLDGPAQCLAHPYLVESNRQRLGDWLAAIDKIEALNPRAVVVGHGPMEPDNAAAHPGDAPLPRRFAWTMKHEPLRSSTTGCSPFIGSDQSGVALGRANAAKASRRAEA
jgi:hypothetical protein